MAQWAIIMEEFLSRQLKGLAAQHLLPRKGRF
jgi:hypothetical protein